MVSGCATLIGGTSQTLTVNSNVAGAEVYLNQTFLGKTPLTAEVKRGQTGVLKVNAAGYQPYAIAINKKISTMFWVNIFSGGSFGSSTDYATGAMYEYEPSTYMVSLQKGAGSAEETSEWQRSEGLRAFVLQNNEALVSDLAAGKGEYVDVLASMLKVRPDMRADAIERWRADYAASKTAMAFADKMVAGLSH
ncbi:MAG: PEGA domain-containing protein [Gemmatimonadaceae bacterium]|jgi:hypothetical protein